LTATKSHGQFIFGPDAGGFSALYWDANGDGAGGPTLIAIFANDVTITGNDFNLV